MKRARDARPGRASAASRRDPLRIAPSGAGQAAALAALDARCFPPADRFSPRVWRHLLGPAARRGSALTLAARLAGREVGAVVGLYRAGSAVVRIYSLAVDPQARGRGLGRRLVGALLARSPRRCRVVSLEVRAANRAARGLYEALGLVQVAVLPRYYADGAAGVRYRGALAAVRAAAGAVR